MATSPSLPRHDNSHHHLSHSSDDIKHVDTGSSSKQTPRSGRTQSWGLWHDAEWWCNCKPRRQAVQCQASRKSANKGKQYWRCQLTKGCGFFLWVEEAKLREKAMASSSASNDAAADCLPATPKTLTQQQITSYGVYSRNTRSQTKHESSGLKSKPLYPILPSAEDFPNLLDSTPPATTSASAAAKAKGKSKATVSESDPTSTIPLSFDQSLPSPAPTASLKRSRDLYAQDYLSDLNSDEERELVDMTNRSAEGVKRARSPFMGTFGTHCKGTRTPDRILNKPKQSVARKLFLKPGHGDLSYKAASICDAPDPKRRKMASFTEDQGQMKQRRSVFMSDSPKEQRKTVSFKEPGGFLSRRDKLQSIDPTSFPSPDPASDLESPRRPSDLQAKVMSLLRNQGVEASVLASVRKHLVASARHADTIALERDTDKAVLKQKTTEIDGLQKQIAALKEQERKMKTQITNMKADLMKIYHEN